MKKLRIGIIDLLHNRPSRSLYRRYVFQNYASIMPQVIGVWCREEGHDVHYSVFTGSGKLEKLLTEKLDLVFISSFTYTAQLAYALSNYFRSHGTATVLGGPHARHYPEDSCHYFDYVVGLTDKVMIKDLLQGFELGNSPGTYLTAKSQPLSIPGVRERWEFIEQVHRSTSVFKSVAMIGSFGCPYHCDFCVDEDIPYTALDMEMIREDLRFLLHKVRHPVVGWHDPNFGMKFNTLMETIESVVPPGRFKFIAECSLSSLNESKVIRLRRNGFIAFMLGIESWYDYGNKSRTVSTTGSDKVQMVAEKVNMIQKYIPFLQTNLMFGFDSESGPEPFTLTKRFIDMAPGIYPAYALLTAFGQRMNDSLKYDIQNRIVPFPFHMMLGLNTVNIIPKNYSWEEFYSHVLDLLKYSFSSRAMYRRFMANPIRGARWITLFLSLSVGGNGKIKYVSSILERLRSDPGFRAFMNKETDQIPPFMVDQIRRDLGPLWEWLPDQTMTPHAKNQLSPEPQLSLNPYN